MVEHTEGKNPNHFNSNICSGLRISVELTLDPTLEKEPVADLPAKKKSNLDPNDPR